MAPRMKTSRTGVKAKPLRTTSRGRPVGSRGTAVSGAVISPLLGSMIIENQNMIMASLRLIERHLGFGTQQQAGETGQQSPQPQYPQRQAA